MRSGLFKLQRNLIQNKEVIHTDGRIILAHFEFCVLNALPEITASSGDRLGGGGWKGSGVIWRTL